MFIDNVAVELNKYFYESVVLLWLLAILFIRRHNYIKILLLFALFVGAICIVKVITQVERPDKSNRMSFPSAHSGVSWFMVMIFNFNPIVTIWAMAISYGRVILKRHWPIDVWVGICMGLIAAHLSL